MPADFLLSLLRRAGACLAALLAVLALSLRAAAAPLPDWTVMVYLCGDNNLEHAALQRRHARRLCERGGRCRQRDKNRYVSHGGHHQRKIMIVPCG